MNGLAICSGIGGLELGLNLAIPGYKTVCYIEREAFAASVVVARMEDQTLDKAPIWDDLTTFEGRQWRGVVDIISAGFPCQPWSDAGKKKGTDDERWIWPDIARIICEVRPGYVFLENVPGLLHGGIEHVLRDLASMGFNAEWGVFSAQSCGAPHVRKRLFILANTQGWKSIKELTQQKRHIERSGNEQVWPPGPNGDWTSIDPLSQPTIRGVADGVFDELVESITQYRSDRIRALGNAVVPITAAVAFKSLLDRLVFS